MRFKLKPRIKCGEEKYKICFAIIPKKTHDYKTVWLEKYLVRKIYHEYDILYGMFEVYKWAVDSYWSQESDKWSDFHDGKFTA